MFSQWSTSSTDHLHDGAKWEVFPKPIIWGGRNTQACLSLLSSPQLFLLSPFLFVFYFFFLKKRQKAWQGTMPTCCFCKKHCWRSRRRIWVTISIASDTQSSCKHRVSLYVNMRRKGASAGPCPAADVVQTQGHARSVWIPRWHDTVGWRRDQDLGKQMQEGASGQRRKWAWSSEVRMIIPSTYVQSTVQILTN